MLGEDPELEASREPELDAAPLLAEFTAELEAWLVPPADDRLALDPDLELAEADPLETVVTVGGMICSTGVKVAEGACPLPGVDSSSSSEPLPEPDPPLEPCEGPGVPATEAAV